MTNALIHIVHSFISSYIQEVTPIIIIYSESLHPNHLFTTSNHLLPNTPRLIRQLLRARNLLEAHSRIIRILKPIEPPLAARLKLLRETITLGSRRDTAVLLAPAVGRSTELRGTCVEDTDAATRHSDVEVVVAEVAAGVCGLHDHFLAGDGAGCECHSGGVGC